MPPRLFVPSLPPGFEGEEDNFIVPTPAVQPSTFRGALIIPDPTGTTISQVQETLPGSIPTISALPSGRPSLLQSLSLTQPWESESTPSPPIPSLLTSASVTQLLKPTSTAIINSSRGLPPTITPSPLPSTTPYNAPSSTKLSPILIAVIAVSTAFIILVFFLIHLFIHRRRHGTLHRNNDHGLSITSLDNVASSNEAPDVKPELNGEYITYRELCGDTSMRRELEGDLRLGGEMDGVGITPELEAEAPPVELDSEELGFKPLVVEKGASDESGGLGKGDYERSRPGR